MKATRRNSIAAVCSIMAFGLLAFLEWNAVSAQPRPRGNAPKAAAGTKKPLAAGDVNLDNSRAYVFVGKTGFGHEHAVEGSLKSGRLSLGATTNAGQLVFDMKSFHADTPNARRYIGLEGATDAGTRQQVEANMLGADVLAVNQFPTATFDIDSAKLLSAKSARGNAQYQLNGNFTLHGVSQPVQVVAEALEEKTETRLRGAFVIQQTSFGITPFSKAFGAIGVANQLKIFGEIRVVRGTEQKPAASDPDEGSRQ